MRFNYNAKMAKQESRKLYQADKIVQQAYRMQNYACGNKW
jgi:hypothetical protein